MPRAFALTSLLFASVCALLLTASCNGGEVPPDGNGGDGGGTVDPNHGTVIVGITSDLRVGVDIDRVHVVMSVDGKVTKEEDLTASSSSSPLKLPAEIAFENLDGGVEVAVQLDAYGAGGGTSPLTSRSASTRIVARKKLLFRVVLDSRCVAAPGSNAPSCAAPETCIAGACAASAVDSKSLLPYSSTWTKVSTDLCKPSGSGAPIVTVGQGQADYLPTMDGVEAQVEAGPQGGHHIWIATRMKGLLQSGSITSVTGHFPELNKDIGPFQVIFTFDQDEGGYCKLYGLRFQLDQAISVDQVLGKTLEVQVKITDKDGTVGVGKRTLVLSKQFI
jgi:hypothetical protein